MERTQVLFLIYFLCSSIYLRDFSVEAFGSAGSLKLRNGDGNGMPITLHGDCLCEEGDTLSLSIDSRSFSEIDANKPIEFDDLTSACTGNIEYSPSITNITFQVSKDCGVQFDGKNLPAYAASGFSGYVMSSDVDFYYTDVNNDKIYMQASVSCVCPDPDVNADCDGESITITKNIDCFQELYNTTDPDSSLSFEFQNCTIKPVKNCWTVETISIREVAVKFDVSLVPDSLSSFACPYLEVFDKFLKFNPKMSSTMELYTKTDEDPRTLMTDVDGGEHELDYPIFCSKVARWSSWSALSSECSVSCGDGTKSRTRSCLNGQIGLPGCDEDRVEYVDCNSGPCPVYCPAKTTPLNEAPFCQCSSGFQARQMVLFPGSLSSVESLDEEIPGGSGNMSPIFKILGSPFVIGDLRVDMSTKKFLVRNSATKTILTGTPGLRDTPQVLKTNSAQKIYLPTSDWPNKAPDNIILDLITLPISFENPQVDSQVIFRDSTWVITTICGKEYYTKRFTDEKMNQEDAKASCNSFKAHLPDICTVNDITVLDGLYPGDFWTAINDNAEEGEWINSSGDIVTNLPWAAREPNNYRGNENCVATRNKIELNDLKCDSNKRNVFCAAPVEMNFPKTSCNPGWKDTNGYSCIDYKTKGYCTSDGAYGPGWNATWGEFTEYQVDGQNAKVCYECGCKVFESVWKNSAEMTTAYKNGKLSLSFISLEIEANEKTVSYESVINALAWIDESDLDAHHIKIRSPLDSMENWCEEDNPIVESNHTLEPIDDADNKTDLCSNSCHEFAACTDALTPGNHSCTCLSTYVGDGQTCTKQKDLGPKGCSFVPIGETLELIPVLWEEFRLEFDIKPSGINEKGSTVIRLTAYNLSTPHLPSGNHGERIPAIYLSPGTSKLMVKYENGNQHGINDPGINPGINFGINDPVPLELDIWSNVVVESKLNMADGNVWFSLTKNGEVIHSGISPKPEQFETVKVRPDDGWKNYDHAANVALKNVVVTTWNADENRKYEVNEGNFNSIQEIRTECIEGCVGCDGPGAICANEVCFCDSGYEKVNGSCIDIDECSTYLPSKLTCNVTEICRNTVGDYECDPLIIPPGHRLDPNCTESPCSTVNIDECAEGSHDCGLDEICSDNDGSFTCPPLNVTEGYARDPNCTASPCDVVDVDECSAKTDDCSLDNYCTNLKGSFNCTPLEIEDGYKRDPNCTAKPCKIVDVDECIESKHNCTLDEKCTNTIGAHNCEDLDIPAGYQRDPKCVQVPCKVLDVNECQENLSNCDSEKEVCINLEGKFECVDLLTNDTLICDLDSFSIQNVTTSIIKDLIKDVDAYKGENQVDIRIGTSMNRECFKPLDLTVDTVSFGFDYQAAKTCGAQYEDNENGIVFSSKININKAGIDTSVLNFDLPLIKVNCVVSNTRIVSPVPVQPLDTVAPFTFTSMSKQNFSLVFELSTDSQFSETLTIENNLVLTGRPLYAKISTQDAINVKIEECEAYQQGDTLARERIQMIVDGCPTEDMNFTQLEFINGNGNSNEVGFTWLSFIFQHDIAEKLVFVCSVRVCADDCSESCANLQRRRRSPAEKALDQSETRQTESMLVFEVQVFETAEALEDYAMRIHVPTLNMDNGNHHNTIEWGIFTASLLLLIFSLGMLVHVVRRRLTKNQLKVDIPNYQNSKCRGNFYISGHPVDI